MPVLKLTKRSVDGLNPSEKPYVALTQTLPALAFGLCRLALKVGLSSTALMGVDVALPRNA